MNHELLNDSVDMLKHIRTELQGNVESSVIEQLNTVIQELEAAQDSGIETAKKVLEVLFLLGNIIEKNPRNCSSLGLSHFSNSSRHNQINHFF